MMPFGLGRLQGMLQNTGPTYNETDKQEKQSGKEQSNSVTSNTQSCMWSGTSDCAAAGQGTNDVAALLQTRTCGMERITSQTCVNRSDQCDSRQTAAWHMQAGEAVLISHPGPGTSVPAGKAPAW